MSTPGHGGRGRVSPSCPGLPSLTGGADLPSERPSPPWLDDGPNLPGDEWKR
jgi:hypothetical protein